MLQTVSLIEIFKNTHLIFSLVAEIYHPFFHGNLWIFSRSVGYSEFSEYIVMSFNSTQFLVRNSSRSHNFSVFATPEKENWKVCIEIRKPFNGWLDSGPS